ncbi:MAG: helix-turn-helix domain-containing protein, partial [Alphaproteobacteria bacterium]
MARGARAEDPAERAARARLGRRLRELRLAAGLAQAELARRVGISPSYLNLIEHGRRRIAGGLLARIAAELGLEPEALEAGEEEPLTAGLIAALGALPPGGARPEVGRAAELAARLPGWAETVTALAGRVRELETRLETLATRMGADPTLAAVMHEILTSVTAIGATASILAESDDIEPLRRRRFLETLREETGRLAARARELSAWLEAGAGADLPRTALDEALAALGWESAAQAAEGQGEAGHGLEAARPGAAAPLTPEARALRDAVLATIAADARRLPEPRLDAAIAAHGWDPRVLARALELPVALIMRRLAARPPRPGWPRFGLVVTDLAGEIRFRRSVPGLRLPLSQGGCPLWPLHRALLRPLEPLAAVLELPPDHRVVAIAALEPVPAADALPPPVLAHQLMINEAEARRIGLAADGLPVVRAGITCRLCPRPGCAARREPPLAG